MTGYLPPPPLLNGHAVYRLVTGEGIFFVNFADFYDPVHFQTHLVSPVSASSGSSCLLRRCIRPAAPAPAVQAAPVTDILTGDSQPEPMSPTFLSTAVPGEDVLNSVDDLLRSLSAGRVLAPMSPEQQLQEQQQSQQQQQQQKRQQQQQQQQQDVTPSGVRAKRRVWLDPSTSSPSVEERILQEMTRARAAASSVDVTFCNCALAVFNSCETDEAQRTRDKIYRILND